MQDSVYKIIELTGFSKTGMENAIQNAIDRASRSVRNLRWFTVEEARADDFDALLIPGGYSPDLPAFIETSLKKLK